ncbi:hypothetical protein SAICODRAFT_31384 [Saitoella complicata NRRL Y-17804]|uniref:Uncharacterized protein n=1 Tax=Saitoella complicata (strain BCRC 22490 / CBS 7301 / JCM 7358 / NBRC 10748 / NRRL Y-17804) TaxID=698492 RepID=A0A0E9NNE9_SAICN|nr:uncharacterized protein SAICODRAFT_31384 [Saitoella complicata NRRL Y-17804]ODQ51126.1 hypothetical protein SAICODRAFT_31384 [Saitoella complicata NRRL Y-17804]GAO51348.1 hypothetical protein G7K_5450-t1 [Saitoella complicata NRRL Y-17804]
MRVLNYALIHLLLHLQTTRRTMLDDSSASPLRDQLHCKIHSESQLAMVVIFVTPTPFPIRNASSHSKHSATVTSFSRPELESLKVKQKMTSTNTTFTTVNRRYLRISSHSLLESRLYIDYPDLPWFNADPSLIHRVLKSIKPLIWTKLKEEAGQKGKGGKRGGARDVVRTKEFVASVFLVGVQTRHEVLRRRRVFGFRSSATTTTKSNPVDLTTTSEGVEGEGEGAGVMDPEPNFLHEDEEEDEDTKKPTLKTYYEGFPIYGKCLCVIISRPSTDSASNSRPTSASKGKTGTKGKGKERRGGMANVAEWIRMSQAVDAGGDVEEMEEIEDGDPEEVAEGS